MYKIQIPKTIFKLNNVFIYINKTSRWALSFCHELCSYHPCRTFYHIIKQNIMEHETKISLQNYKLYVEGHFMPD